MYHHDMNATRNGGRWFSPPLTILPSIYVVVIVLTAMLSVDTPGGTFYRIVGINPVAGVSMMVCHNVPIIVGIFLVSGTPWWYLVGRIGWESRKRKISRLSLGLGAVLTLFTGWVATSVTADILKQDIHGGFVTGPVILQYMFVAFLCVGALLSTICAVIATSLK